jgi:redox-regulated HSP33 family molecular chaperone
MGSSLKGEETLQVNLVGQNGIKNVLAITDGSLKIRGMVGSPRFSLPSSYKRTTTKIGRNKRIFYAKFELWNSIKLQSTKAHDE